MKILLGLAVMAILAAVAVPWLHFSSASGSIAAVFPQSRIERTALKRCEDASASFDRFNPTSRDACLHDAATRVPQHIVPPHTAQAPNQIDLRKAAGRNEIIRIPPASPTPVR